MFIDKNGFLQAESLEEIKENKELVISEFERWEVPSVEQIEIALADGLTESAKECEALGVDFELDPAVFYIMKITMEYTVSYIAENLGTDSIAYLKINRYANNSYLAIADLMEKVC